MHIVDIKKLSPQEMLQVMEVIWDDLDAAVEAMDVPRPNHFGLTTSASVDGVATLRGWDEVKDSIGNKC